MLVFGFSEGREREREFWCVPQILYQRDRFMHQIVRLFFCHSCLPLANIFLSPNFALAELIMAIGLVVDYMVHLVHYFLHQARAAERATRVCDICRHIVASVRFVGIGFLSANKHLRA